MKKLAFPLSVAFALCLPLSARAQPVLPQLGGTGCSNPVTVAGLSSYAVAGAMCQVRDGDSATDCAVGGGSTTTICCFDGSAWVACGGGGGGGGATGDVTAVGSCTAGDCFTDGGTGTSLVIEGSSNDSFEFTFQFPTNPTVDRTVTVPDETGTVCTTGAICPGYSASTHTHTVGDTAATSWFTGSDGANKLYFEGPTADGNEILVTAADAAGGDKTLTIPNESGQFCTTGAVCPGYGNVTGPGSATAAALAAYSGTTGKLLDNTGCLMSDYDGDLVLDKITCPGGFASEARTCATNSDCNYTSIPFNSGAAGVPTCANVCDPITGSNFCVVPYDDDTVHMCKNGTDLGALPGAGGTGDNITINGTAATDMDLDDSTPAAPSTALNVKWQKDTAAPDNVSGYVDYGTGLTVSAGELVPNFGTASGTVSEGNHVHNSCWYVYITNEIGADPDYTGFGEGSGSTSLDAFRSPIGSAVTLGGMECHFSGDCASGESMSITLQTATESACTSASDGANTACTWTTRLTCATTGTAATGEDSCATATTYNAAAGLDIAMEWNPSAVGACGNNSAGQRVASCTVKVCSQGPL